MTLESSSSSRHPGPGSPRVHERPVTPCVPLLKTSPAHPDLEIFQLQAFHQVCVPHQTTVADTHILVLLHDVDYDILAFLYTGAYFCMATCNSLLSSEVLVEPLLKRIWSMRAILLSPALAGNFTGAVFGLTSSAVVSAACRPKT
eukprot:CAMPEP_0194776606 /NCGR_PEP_ID=MMETSP0323_2-20130528/63557_1 /TAXON_ID=2866 ORGANISM="Crypthecodinium cohnii, Strain Seligo" /NCGR_SAMPLE_ID=MMETSP0323_2 /ASSEMBLY_ACC=CAM_ASM_000346 /LENGTH=144 /DNA_ID=CAMNT_0039713083 /DNA_START=192 /DNA_END=624 /DNA_ORIENTATION=+